ncbi:hypothetical protein DPX39_000005200 [Trypanosoma brucei equiperdum]|uniref:Uncharacterized protein n=1 Tax=Trypanosoma brucei equiperdum TaxID=630700 RepID=A0A3L6KV00_9TRYP|nr:hypothetical protein DPX39_000009900 [Trypanosoma brucei equiperdum]RHW67367.1 hypothetical protein DPX39_000012300 [Trypanosoma brucei equiperdum]RHW67379.1 hypothetical protein DPX39_000014600 [Trypanosoma brucei equiperdum]RHW67401.1 hypothetical protein DPX39_000005200 [Trypanosoma brucei equiperdum]
MVAATQPALADDKGQETAFQAAPIKALCKFSWEIRSTGHVFETKEEIAAFQIATEKKLSLITEQQTCDKTEQQAQRLLQNLILNNTAQMLQAQARQAQSERSAQIPAGAAQKIIKPEEAS